MSREMKDSGIEWIGEIPDDWEIKKALIVFRTDKYL
jgi:type I restriction enzyme S subunit